MKLIYVVEPHADTAILESDLLQEAGFAVRVVSPDDAGTASSRQPPGRGLPRSVRDRA